MIKVFLSIVAKELLDFLRSWGLVIIVLYSFTLDVNIAGSGMQIEPKNVSVGYVDYTGGGISQKILSHLHKPEFVSPKRFLSQKQLSRAIFDKEIFDKEIMVGIVFDQDFEKNYRSYKNTTINGHPSILVYNFSKVYITFFKVKIHSIRYSAKEKC